MFTYVPRRVLGDSIAGPSLEFHPVSTSRRSCFQKTNTQIIGIKIKVPNDRALFVWLTNAVRLGGLGMALALLVWSNLC